MRHRYAMFLLLALACTASVSKAQSTISPGMSKAQVVEKLGKPVTERSTGSSTFLFYRNGQERKVGMNDIVTLENDKVTDAVFRSSSRKYSGTSSSPSAISSATAIKTGHTASTPPLNIAAPAPSAPASAPAPKTPAKSLPAAAAQAQDVARPIPQARSAMREKETEAAAKIAEPKPADPAAATDPKKPVDPKAQVDPKAMPAKKP
jgi:hypothetical protein